MKIARRWLILALPLLPVAGSAATAWVEVHPAGPSVPENLLRIELRFSRPQPLPFDVGRVKLSDASTGATIENALLDLALPDAEGRWITVLLDPGRVKTAAGPNRAAGRALSAGSVVRLTIESDRPGELPVSQRWAVGPPAERRLDAQSWRLVPPRPQSRMALRVDLGPNPISSAGARLMAVRDASGRPVPGRPSLDSGDTRWRFTPERDWREGRYELVTHPQLEDSAGNRACAAFEEIEASRKACDQGLTLLFRIGYGQGLHAPSPPRQRPPRSRRQRAGLAS